VTKRSPLFSSAARAAWLVASLGLSVIAAWLIARDVEWADVARFIARANGGWLLAALASFVLTLVVKALRWRALFVPRPRDMSVWHLFAAMVFGQMFNMSLPMRAGDVSRAAIIGRPGLSRMTALATVAAEKWVDMAAALVLALGLLPFMAWPDWARSPLDVVGAVVLMGVLGLIGVAMFRRPISALVQRVEQASLPSLVARVMQWLRRAWQGMAALRTPGAALGVAGWTVLTWALGALTNWLVGESLGLHGTAVMWGFVLLVLQVGVAAPSTPGRLFVFEALAMGALSPFGVRGDLALAYAVVLHVVVIGPIILGGLALWPFVVRAGNAQLQAEVES
jgi:uncharacterized protein (TIRG00374 family)